MSVVKMSLYQAMSKKKILEDQVNNLKSYLLVEKRRIDKEESVTGTPLTEIDKAIESGMSHSIHILDNYITLKAAINDANAKTIVKIDGKEMSIANALIRQRLLAREEEMYRRMLQNYQNIEAEVTRHNDKFLSSESIAAYINKTLSESKRTPELVESLTNQYKEENTWKIYDPKGIKDLAEAELERIARFREDLHFELTKVNIETEIEVEFKD